MHGKYEGDVGDNRRDNRQQDQIGKRHQVGDRLYAFMGPGLDGKQDRADDKDVEGQFAAGHLQPAGRPSGKGFIDGRDIERVSDRRQQHDENA